jgi:hypothetical protein
MKRLISLLIGGSMMLVAAAWAQQPEASSTPEKKKNREQSAQETGAAPHRAGANAGQPQGNREKPNASARERAEGRTHEAGRGEEAANDQQTAKPETEQRGHGRKAGREHGANAAASPAASAAAEENAAASPAQTHQGKNRMKNRAANAQPSASPGASTPAGASTTGAKAAASATPAASANTAAAAQQNTQVNASGKPKKVDQQQLQQIKSQHASFKAQAKPQQVPAVTFNQNYRIQEAQTWTGPQYEVFRTYHPEWHDAGWYRSHYGRVELIGGGYYYFNSGYWYPAWGYNPSNQYYAYNGPIYVGHQEKPWDQVIADVQAELQQMGYYRGEVDGLLGPLTREALRAYQNDNGLVATSAIDEPTLDSLELS